MTDAKAMETRVPSVAKFVEDQGIITNQQKQRRMTGQKGRTIKDGAGSRSLAGASEKDAIVMYRSHHDHQVTHQNRKSQLRFFSPQGSILIFLGLPQVSARSTL